MVAVAAMGKEEREEPESLEPEPQLMLAAVPTFAVDAASAVLARMAQVVAAAKVSLPASPVMEEPEEPLELEEPEEPLELPSPRRLAKIKDSGWASDDTKIYEIDKRGKHTHTHTQPVVVSLFC
jgi:hypothetical protein